MAYLTEMGLRYDDKGRSRSQAAQQAIKNELADIYKNSPPEHGGSGTFAIPLGKIPIPAFLAQQANMWIPERAKGAQFDDMTFNRNKQIYRDLLNTPGIEEIDQRELGAIIGAAAKPMRSWALGMEDRDQKQQRTDTLGYYLKKYPQLQGVLGNSNPSVRGLANQMGRF